jgi:pSer/pThr/pTyr-binding forkhead associated (FHA) protein
MQAFILSERIFDRVLLMIARLVPINGGSPILLDRDVTLVGRKHGLCDLIIEHGSVSKLQCLIVKTDGLLFIRDLCSTNGTKVNGQRVTRGVLLPGDELAFAKVKYRVELAAANLKESIGPIDQTEVMTAFPEVAEPKELESLLADHGSESDVRLLTEEEQGEGK